MANELRVGGTVYYRDSASEAFLQVPLLEITPATLKFTRLKQSIGTAEEAVQLGEVTAPKWAMFVNRDATNYVELKTGTGGTIVAKLLPGEWAIIPLGSGMQAPYAIANTLACLLDVLVVSL